MPHKGLPPRDPKVWLEFAASNLVCARSVLPGMRLEDHCFNAQQAAEKAVKAVFIRHSISFPYVHELERLLKLLEQNAIKVPKYVWKAMDLSRFAIETRYPGMSGPITKREYRRLLRIAESVVRWAERQVAKS